MVFHLTRFRPGRSAATLPHLFRLALALAFTLILFPVTALGQPRVLLHWDERPLLSSDQPRSGVHEVLDSIDLIHWHPFATTLDSLADFPDTRPHAANRFYRLLVRPRTGDDDWANQITAADDLLLSPPEPAPAASRWVKFAILEDEPHRVFFQDSTRYPFHFDFATRRLEPFLDADPTSFDSWTLRNEGRRAVLGAVLFPPHPAIPEFGIQFAGNEPFPPADTARWFHLVRSAVRAPEGHQALYFPSFEQSSVTLAHPDFFALEGIPVASAARWVDTDQCYAAGWAFGRLVILDPEDIGAAYADGRLTHRDILAVEAVPAEIPPVAGLITFSPATPNSHVAILSRSFGIPFVHLSRSRDHQRILEADGREILLMAEDSTDPCRVTVFPLDAPLTEEQRARLTREPAPLTIAPVERLGRLSVPADDLTPDDVPFVGGKAANFGVLRRSIPDHSPTPALAFTMDLWLDYMEQRLTSGLTLRATIDAILEPHVFPPDIPQLRSDLERIRDLVEAEADFTPAQRAAIVEALSPFDPRRRIRFRSSTNVEDSERFVGAGLYDSYSGCLWDDTDADDQGPSGCDPLRQGERGVFRAIRKVFAGFYNENAFLERLRHDVPEHEAGMAVLVHYSFPDPIELANGVATLRILPSGIIEGGELVTQAGSASVANPDSNALPEVVRFTLDTPTDPSLQIESRSALVPLGGTVLDWETDYQSLIGLLRTASLAFVAATPRDGERVIDLEYKKTHPGNLVIKQIRDVPPPPEDASQPPFVLNDLGRLQVFQHHGKDLFANHRLKSIWEFQSLRLDNSDLGDPYDFLTRLQTHDGIAPTAFNGLMSELPEASFRLSQQSLQYRWRHGDGEDRTDFTLTVQFDSDLRPGRPVALGEATLIELSAQHATPKPRLSGFPPTLVPTRSETTRLVALNRVVDGTLERSRRFQRARITITTDYTLGFLDFRAPGIGIFDGKSFPLVRWNGPTTIRGLTQEPIELHGEFSRTYDSTRHNFVETFLLVPHLEPGLDPAVLDDLRERNIQGILVSQWTASEPPGPASIQLWGFDDTLRDP